MVDLFLRILDMSITASWVILAVMAVRVLLRKAPKKYSYALWAAALFRLLCPVSLQSGASLFNFRAFRPAAKVTGELQFVPRDMEFPQFDVQIPGTDMVIPTGTPAVDTAVSQPLPVVTPEVGMDPMQVIMTLGMIIWLIGIAVMVVTSVIQYARLRKGLRYAVRVEGNIWKSENVRSPFLVGLVKPKIYLPYGLDDQTQAYILAHEQYHLKRFDHIAKLLGYAALTIHWFNPLCHLAVRLMNRDMEMSCDEHVLDRNNIPTTQYSYSLLTIATNRRFPAAAPLAFAETGVKERMINVLNWKKPKKWVSVVAVMVCVILLISCATNPKVNDTTTDATVDEPVADTTAAADPTENTTPAEPVRTAEGFRMEIPGLKWGATPEEIRAALDLPAEKYIYDVPYHENRWLMVVQNVEFFGEEVAYGRFSFVKNDWNEDFTFKMAELFYKDETDMALVKDALTELYGDPNESLGFTRYRVRNGAVEAYTDGFRAYYPDKDKAVFGYWQSGAMKGDFIPADVQQTMAVTGILDSSGVPSGLDTADPASWDVVQDYLRRESAVLLYCTNGATGAAPLPGNATKNAVIFNAGDSVTLPLYLAKRSAAEPNVALLEFPGLQWNSFLVDVKIALGLEVGQILADVQQEYEQDYEYNIWNLLVKDIDFLGFTAETAHLMFVQYPGRRPGLMNITLEFPEGTDGNALKAAIMEVYGEGSAEQIQSYHFDEQGELVADNMDSMAEPPYREEGFPYYWYSTVKGTEVLSAEAQERYVEHTVGLNPVLSRDGLLKYLELTPVVRVSIMDWTNSDTCRVSFNANQLVHHVQQFEE